MTNLFSNAIKYAPGKPILVSLTQDRRRTTLSVKDDGIGIAYENRVRIFEPYERVVSVTKISGLGLGLFITKEIVEAHGGRISVESAVGKGSTFFVEFPRGAHG